MGAWLAVALSLVLSWGVQHTLRLLLAGVVVGVVFGAMASLLLVMFPQIQGSVQSFMLGSTAYVSWSACGLMLFVLLVSWLVSVAASPMLDGLALGESTALSLGLPVKSLRWLMLAVLALCTAAAVAQTGLIAFVGLAAPHLVRARVKAVHGKTLSLSCLMGAVLLGGADLMARSLMAPTELPVGVLTAILGWRLHVVPHARHDRKVCEAHGRSIMSAPHKIAIKATKVSVQHEDFKAVNQVSLELHSGEWVALVGPNGAGKSSLLKALAGLTPATGHIELLGKPWAAWQRRERAQKLAWLGQAEAGQDDLTVYDVAMLGRLPHQAWLASASAQDRAVVEVALKLCRLGTGVLAA
jgi:ABC-type Mn2+/Zn2+ transport system permease subunit